MGAYLSEPVTETLSSDEKSDTLIVGASSMQGWRTSQEDAHSCCLNYDKDSSLFAVFDGHGGAEVAQYSAVNLPRFLKQTQSYKDGRYAEALQEAFLQFDAALLQPEVIKELKALAGTMDDNEDDEEENDANEASLLMEEASIPIEDLIARYGSGVNADLPTKDNNPKQNLPPHLKQEMSKEKPLSPYLRAKQNNSESSSEKEDLIHQTCSSSSSSSCSKAIDSVCEASCSSSSALNGERDTVGEGKTNECESVSSSSSAGAHAPKSDCETDNNNVSSSKNDDGNDEKSNEVISDSIPSSTSYSNKTKAANNEEPAGGEEEEGDVSTSSEAKTNEAKFVEDDCKDDSQKPSSTDKPSEESVSVKGKGKQKKQIVKPSVSEETLVDPKPVYKAFLEDCVTDSDSGSEDMSDDYDGGPANSDSEEEDAELEDEEDSSDEDEEEDSDDNPRTSKMLFTRGMTEEPGKDSGCTAVVALLRDHELYVANAGDSRCVVSRAGKAIEMSFDHKPEDEVERDRIRKAGGKITGDGRVNGGLNLSRAIGDHAYKDNHSLSLKDQMITAFPDVRTLTVDSQEDEFMVLACDGIWNSMTSQQVVDFVTERIQKKESGPAGWKLSEICEELFHECLSPNTMGDGTGCDNMTCVIVRFVRSRKRKEAEPEEENSMDKENDGSEDVQSDRKRQRMETCNEAN